MSKSEISLLFKIRRHKSEGKISVEKLLIVRVISPY